MKEEKTINNSKGEDTQLSTELLTKFFEQVNKKLDDNLSLSQELKDEMSSMRTTSLLDKKDFEIKIDGHEKRIVTLEVDKKDRDTNKKTVKKEAFERMIEAGEYTLGVVIMLIFLVGLLTALGIPVGSLFKNLFSMIAGA